MTFCTGGVCKEYTFPAERLWEVVERADARFGCDDTTAEAALRFASAKRIADNWRESAGAMGRGK